MNASSPSADEPRDWTRIGEAVARQFEYLLALDEHERDMFDDAVRFVRDLESRGDVDAAHITLRPGNRVAFHVAL